MTAPFTNYVLNSSSDETRESLGDICVTEPRTMLSPVELSFHAVERFRLSPRDSLKRRIVEAE